MLQWNAFVSAQKHQQQQRQDEVLQALSLVVLAGLGALDEPLVP